MALRDHRGGRSRASGGGPSAPSAAAASAASWSRRPLEQARTQLHRRVGVHLPPRRRHLCMQRDGDAQIAAVAAGERARAATPPPPPSARHSAWSSSFSSHPRAPVLFKWPQSSTPRSCGRRCGSCARAARAARRANTRRRRRGRRTSTDRRSCGRALERGRRLPHVRKEASARSRLPLAAHTSNILWQTLADGAPAIRLEPLPDLQHALHPQLLARRPPAAAAAHHRRRRGRRRGAGSAPPGWQCPSGTSSSACRAGRAPAAHPDVRRSAAA